VVAVNVDTSVNPGDDFFDYANGAWLKSHPIPASEAYWGIGKLVQEDLYSKLRKASEDAAAANATAGSRNSVISGARRWIPAWPNARV
jgi:putative endopeptidase